MARHAGDLRVADEVDRVGPAGVLRDACVVEVDVVAVLVVDHVFEHRAEPERLEDVGLRLGSEVDRLGVAASLDVKDARVAPAVLVVADQEPLRVGGERGLACAREAEEQRRHARFAVGGGRAVHREDVALRREVVEQREHALLHLAGILGAEDHHLLRFERQVDARLRGHPVRPLVGRKPAGVVDHGVGVAEVGEFLLRGPDQHRVHEQSVVRPRADHANLEPVGRIPAGEGVDAVEDLPGVEVVLRPLEIDQEGLLVDRHVHAAPPDVVLTRRVSQDPLVFWRTARLLARVGDQGAGIGDRATGVDAERLRVEFGGSEVAAHVGDGDAMGGEIDAAHGGLRGAT